MDLKRHVRHSMTLIRSRRNEIRKPLVAQKKSGADTIYATLARLACRIANINYGLSDVIRNSHVNSLRICRCLLCFLPPCAP